MKSALKKFLFECLGVIFIAIFFVIYTNLSVLEHTDGILSEDKLPGGRIALVFGGGMKATGSMSDMQTARVDKAIELYKSGKVAKLMMTGDDGAVRVDEVSAMKKYAVEHGVNTEDISIDPHGYRTYESCYRESKVYDVKEVVAVSQTFHLPRIIYFCSRLGIDTVGVASDQPPYQSGIKIIAREILARTKGWLQIEILRPLPRTLAPN